MASIQKYKTKSGEDRWRVRYRENGKPKSKSKRSYKAAAALKAEIEYKQDRGIFIEPIKTTVRELGKEWFATLPHKVVRGHRLKTKTIKAYGIQLDHIYDYIGDKYVQSLTAADIEKMYSDYRACRICYKVYYTKVAARSFDKISHARKFIKENSLNTTPREFSVHRGERAVYYLHQTMSPLIKFAVKKRLLHSNPLELVDAPQQCDADVKTIDFADIPKYLNCAKEEWVFVAVCIAMFTGARREEVWALDWAHVLFQESRIFIERAEDFLAGVWEESLPKSRKPRYAVMPDPLACVLSAVYQNQMDQRSRGEYETTCRFSGRPNNYVVTMENGKRPVPNSITYAWQRLQKKAGLDVVTFHSLKHTAKALMDYFGVPSNVSSRMLAHEDEKFSEDRYGYLFEEQMNEAKQLMDSSISKFFSP